MQAIVLCYHKIGPQAEEGRRLNVAPERLYSHASHFKRAGYRFARAGELAGTWSERTICLTFDDAYWSTVEWGLPVLDGLGLPGTLYAVASLVGKSSVWDPSFPRALATWDRLVEAQNRGHEIGNHTSGHPHLPELAPEAQQVQVRSGDETLRGHGLVPGSFCYPYGSHDQNSMAAVRACGYRVGLILGKRIADESDDRLALPRIVVGFSDALPVLLYKIHLRPKLRRNSR
jgi:peptidoglycan/xylan/chitin deacetylase (PgdA/CDA1 family)